MTDTVVGVFGAEQDEKTGKWCWTFDGPAGHFHSPSVYPRRSVAVLAAEQWIADHRCVPE